MQQLGHIGFALAITSGISILLYLPLLVILWLCGIASVMSILPDRDIRFHAHRGVTHSMVFTIALSIACGVIAYIVWLYAAPYIMAYVPQSLLQNLHDGFGVFMVGFAPVMIGLLSHVIIDSCTYAGVPLLWPFNKQRYSLKLFKSSNVYVNILLGISGFALFIISVLTR